MPTEIALKPVVYRIAGMERAVLRPRIEYASDLTMDVYYPADHSGAALPAIIYALGYRDAGVQTLLGCQFRETRMCVSWAQLFAACGMAAIVYETADPAKDLASVVAFVRGSAGELGIDPERLGVYASSGNVPVALAAVMDHRLQCAALSYGFMLEVDGSTAVADAARQFRFANPAGRRTVDDLPAGSPLLVVRAGKEQFTGLNQSIDGFAAQALRRNLPLTLINHASGPHAFDLFDDTVASRSVIRAILTFFQSCLSSTSNTRD